MIKGERSPGSPERMKTETFGREIFMSQDFLKGSE